MASGPSIVRGVANDAAVDGMPIKVREYGTGGPDVVLLHGGPGAAGYVAPVARGLAESFHVFEPFQRGSGGEPLTVAGHVADLHEVVAGYCTTRPPAVVGHSWGAMLALAYAAAHPADVACLVLIGCGTFDAAARQRMDAIRKERMTETRARRLERLAAEPSDPDERLRAMGRLFQRIDSYELISATDELERCDARAHEETWQDMLRLQAEGVYPSAFGTISVPVIMMHGAADPHPGRLIRASLVPHLPQLEYREWERCGHYPWLEKAARDDFFVALGTWLSRHMTVAESPPM